MIDTRTNRVVSTIAFEGPEAASPSCAAASRLSIPRATRSRARSAAPTATSIPPSTALRGISNPTASVATSSITPSKTSTERSPTSGTAAIRTCPPNVDPRTEKYFWRSENYDDLTLTDLVMLCSQPAPAPQSLASCRTGTDTRRRSAARRCLNALKDKFGKPIPITNRCAYCHSGPKGTSQKSFDVGTQKPTDNTGLLDTPQLTNIALRRRTCTTAQRPHSRRSGPFSTRRTSTAAPTI